MSGFSSAIWWLVFSGTPDMSYLTKDQKLPSTRSSRWNGRWNVHDGVRPAILLCGLPHTVANLVTDPSYRTTTSHWGFCPVFMSTKSLINDLVTGTRVPVDRMVSHTGTGIARTMRQIHETTATRETGAGNRYIVRVLQ